MATFGAYFSVEDYGKLWFEADSLEQAQDLIDQVPERMSIEDLPSVKINVKVGSELVIDGLERIG
tara:strand:+ start:574 stop:768 length:195 start_codon:yes stop_codon:yes gene_type:complete